MPFFVVLLSFPYFFFFMSIANLSMDFFFFFPSDSLVHTYRQIQIYMAGSN